MADQAPPSTSAAPSGSPPETTAAATTTAGAASAPETAVPPAALDVLEPEDAAAEQDDAPDQGDQDSAFGEKVDSTASLSESILEYRTIQGRTYHANRANAAYWGPNDEQSSESMDINHHLLSLAIDGKLCLSPIKDDVQKVLDVGTGTGIWAIDFADEYPNAEVIGTDVSPIQPTWIPPNLRFEIDDATQEWTFEPNSFDFIHMRYLFGSIADWQALFDQAYKCCAPGGWVESFEMSSVARSDDDSIPEGSPLTKWSEAFVEGGKKFGRSFVIVDEGVQQKCMEKAGFTDITVKDIKCPISPWPKDKKYKEMGMYSVAALEADIEGYVLMMFTTIFGWKKEEIQVYTALLRKQVRDPNVHCWYLMRIVYGRKPESG